MCQLAGISELSGASRDPQVSGVARRTITSTTSPAPPLALRPLQGVNVDIAAPSQIGHRNAAIDGDWCAHQVVSGVYRSGGEARRGS